MNWETECKRLERECQSQREMIVRLMYGSDDVEGEFIKMGEKVIVYKKDTKENLQKQVDFLNEKLARGNFVCGYCGCGGFHSCDFK